MKSKIKEMFPKWCGDNEENYELMLTDDIDSLVSCALLKKIKGYETNYYYDFDTIYEIKESDVSAIATDCDLVNGRCWSNHVTMLSKNDSVNKKSANLNNVGKISRDNYFQKFCGSTVIQIWSYYDLPLPESEEGKMALLCLDAGYKGHYNSRFIEVHSKYLKAMGFEELIEVLNRHSMPEFKNLIGKYNMANKLKLNKNNVLITEIDLSKLEGLFCLDLSIPNKPFYVRREFNRDRPTQLYTSKTYTKDDFPEMFSVALINRNKVAFTKN